MNESLANSAASLATYLAAAKSRSETVAGVQLPRLASSALMRSGHVPTEELVAVADAAHGLHGRTMPGSRIPIVSPAELVARRPDKVLLFVRDLLTEVREALTEIESTVAGGLYLIRSRGRFASHQRLGR